MAKDNCRWLEAYYSKISDAHNFWLQRRDTVTNWALTFNFGTAAIYAGFLSSAVPVAPFFRILFLAIAVALSTRFFAFDLVMYAWVQKYGFLTREIEKCMTADHVNYSRAKELVNKIDHERYTTISQNRMLVSQLRAGYLLILLIPCSLLVYQLIITPLGETNFLLLDLLGLYLAYEILNFLTYTPLRKNPKVEQFAT